MSAIAARAGVSPTLLYKTYGTKAALAKRLYDVTLIGDDLPEPLNTRPEITEIMDEPDPRQKLAMYVHLGCSVNERLGPLLSRLRAGAVAGDADLADLMITTDRERLLGHTAMARELAAADGLRPDVPVERAADMLWTLFSPEVMFRLTAERGWTLAETESWLTEQLCAALLPAAAVGPGAVRRKV